MEAGCASSVLATSVLACNDILHCQAGAVAYSLAYAMAKE
jgi:hypothetical protein